MAANAQAEMPFLDHLEELRWRILWSLGAFVAGFAIAFVLATKYNFILLLEHPIAPYLQGKKLIVTHPADPFRLTLSVSIWLGVVLAPAESHRVRIGRPAVAPVVHRVGRALRPRFQLTASRP